MEIRNKKTLVTVSVALGLLLFALGLARDLRMGNRVTDEKDTAPPVVVEGLDVDREMSGDLWSVKAVHVEQRGNVSDAESLDIVINTSGGTVWLVSADRGHVVETDEDITLYEAKGFVSSDVRPFFWKAPSAHWIPASETWMFDEGLEAWDDTVYLKGNKGIMPMSGDLRVEEGASVQWNEESR